MAGDESSPVSGEVMGEEAQERLRYAMEKVQRDGMLTARLAAKISRSPFFNHLTERRIESAHRVARAENAFMMELRTHQLTKDRLLNLDVDIAAQRAGQEADRAAAEARLVRERSASAMAELEAQVRLEHLKAQLAALKKANEGASDEKSQEQRYQEQLDAEAKKAAFEAQRKVLQAQQKIAVRRALLVERDRMIAEITREARENPSPEQEFEIQNIRDLFQVLIDEA